MTMSDLQVGDVLGHRTTSWIEAEVRRIPDRDGQQHYELMVRTPGCAPRRIHLGADGVSLTFAMRKE